MSIAVSKAAREAMACGCAQPESCVMGPLAQRRQAPRVVFYRLKRKFVDSEASVSQDGASIIYYTLAVGHHTGIIDCLEEDLSCSKDEYLKVLAVLPEGALRYKLEGVLRCEEIQVDNSHVPPLAAAVADVLASDAVAADSFERKWLERFSCMLEDIKAEASVYYMGRLRG